MTDTATADAVAKTAGIDDIEILCVSDEAEARLTLPFAQVVAALGSVAAEFDGVEMVDLPVLLHQSLQTVLGEVHDEALTQAAYLLHYANTLERFSDSEDRFFFVGVRNGKALSYTCETAADMERRAASFRTKTIADLPLDDIRRGCLDARIEVRIISPDTSILCGLNQMLVADALHGAEMMRKSIGDEHGLVPFAAGALRNMHGAVGKFAEGEEDVGAMHAEAAAWHVVALVAHLNDTKKFLRLRYIIMNFSPNGAYPICYSEDEKMLFDSMVQQINDRYGVPDDLSPPKTQLH